MEWASDLIVLVIYCVLTTDMGLRVCCWKSRHKKTTALPGASVPRCGGSGPSVPCWGGTGRGGLFAALLLCACLIGCCSATKTVVQKEAEYDMLYNDTVTSDNQTIYAFNHTVSRNKVSSPPACRSASFERNCENVCEPLDIFDPIL